MKYILHLVLLFFPFFVSAAAVSVMPEAVIQGEPFMVRIEGAIISDVQKASFDGKKIDVFLYQSKPAALVGVDLNKKPGVYELAVKLASGLPAPAGLPERRSQSGALHAGGQAGETLTRSVVVGERKKVEVPLGIPAKLGGNTAVSQKKLVVSLTHENAILSGLRTGKKVFWSEPFRLPVAEPIVTDTYGYSRKTGAYSIAHKGTDFRAEEGTPVLAMNRGVVRFARESRIYGKTIAVDHGLGLMTFYMHLSKINVNVGELVAKGQTIGLSGKTGYAEMPHLHLSVRINGVSVDPMRFMALFPLL